MKNKLTVLKLGGSVITIKDKPLTPNTQVMRRLAHEIASSEVSPLIIVHGGGSFGHPLAAEYNIAGGLKGQGQMVGFSKTHNSMVKLNMLIVETLLDEGLPAVSFAPSSLMITKQGRIASLYKDVLEKALEIGSIPVLYGDAVLDYDQGFAILSGDQITARLAIEFGAEKIVFGIDVDGLYTCDPKINHEARLLKEIVLSKLEEMAVVTGCSRTIDVTGGMRGKIAEIIDPVSKGIEVLFINALIENRVYRALKGEEIIGTRIIKR
ncbi:MAG: isopentenyl phosphate kinase [Candidatus Bathyarchaeia archaeon]